MDETRDPTLEQKQHSLLWDRFRAGDEGAFRALTETYYRVLANYGMKLSRDKDFVADCIQELFLELWERRRFLGDAVFVKSYLLKAVRNKIIKESIKLRRFKEPEDLEFGRGEYHPIELEIVSTEAEREKIDHLKSLLGDLTKRQQEIIYLRFYQNLEFDEISEVMGLTRQSVANLLHRTIKDMRSKWIISLFFWILL